MSGDGIIIGADHAGFHLKEAIKAHLTRRGLAVTDVGTAGPDPVDYPLHGAEAAARVSSVLSMARAVRAIPAYSLRRSDQ